MTPRQKFLESSWDRYPAVSSGTKSLREVYEGWRKFAFGNAPLGQGPLLIGLRLAHVGSHHALGLSEDLPVEVRWHDLTISGFRVEDVLKTGDIILVETSWQSVIPAPESHRIEFIQAQKMTLLCPNMLGGPADFPMPPFSIDDSRAWALFQKLIRDVFRVLGFLEVRTPTLVPSPGIEPHLDPFKTELVVGRSNREFYLPTSPEYHLKKMLSHGWLKIFEFKESFRNGEVSDKHQPEFMMLEWYRAFADLSRIEKDLQGMFNYFILHWPFDQFGLETPKSVAIQRISMSELFRSKTGFDLKIETSVEDLRNLSQSLGVQCSAEDSWDDVFFRIFVTKVEEGLGMKQPLLVYDYPPSQAALARVNERGWADRFELYYRGFEIANAYHELNDPKVQRERFQKDLILRKALGKECPPMDEELLKALEFGMPPSSGIALGMERLFLALTGKTRLDQARVFSINLNS